MIEIAVSIKCNKTDIITINNWNKFYSITVVQTSDVKGILATLMHWLDPEVQQPFILVGPEGMYYVYSAIGCNTFHKNAIMLKLSWRAFPINRIWFSSEHGTPALWYPTSIFK